MQSSARTTTVDNQPVEKVPTPIRTQARIASLDVLRGFAMLGILAVNIESFAGPESLHDIPTGMARRAFTGWHAHLDLIILIVKWLFVEGKMRALFAALFGAGSVLLTQRIERGPHASLAGDVFQRRNLWLLLFGLLHGVLIWQGDILGAYALLGLLFLYPLRHVAAKTLLIVGLSVTLIGGTLGQANFLHGFDEVHQDALRSEALAARANRRTPTPAQQQAFQEAAKAAMEEPLAIRADVHNATAPYVQQVLSRAGAYFGFYIDVFRSGWVFEVIGYLIFGMGLYKTGFLSGSLRPRTYVWLAFSGYAISAPAIIWGTLQASRAGFTLAAAFRWMYLPYEVTQAAGMIANASIIILLSRQRSFRSLTTALTAVGRTAFSNYILTSLLCQSYFVWGPWKAYGKLEYYQELYVVAVVWVLNVVLSELWLHFFNYGPLEWLWRSLTYWRLQPMRLVPGKQPTTN